MKLKKRGLVNSLTSPDIINLVNKPTTVYCGLDPTAPSLHLGNLLALICLLHFNVLGHRVITLIGGATGLIGDPSGRNVERKPLPQSTIEHNIVAIDRQIRKIFDNGRNYASRRGYVSIYESDNVIIKNNLEWFQKMTALDFLSDIGRYFRVGTMLTKDRIENEGGISFTEFSYQLLQAYDFWYLYSYYNCQVQLGGSDQWGNITNGIDLIHKKSTFNNVKVNESKNPNIKKVYDAFGITIPLLLTSSGEKFGKSAGNAVWLDDKMTSAYEFYQYFMKISDADVEKYLYLFTFLKGEEITQILKTHSESPEKHHAQEKLASEATEMVHGLEGLRKARVATDIIFGTSIKNMKSQDIINAFSNDTQHLKSIKRNEVLNYTIDRVAATSGVCKSRSEANKLIKAGGLYLNNERIDDSQYKLLEDDLLDGILFVFRT
ncbi:8826_t:CDS:2, partial [Acaulospora morrowiae]